MLAVMDDVVHHRRLALTDGSDLFFDSHTSTSNSRATVGAGSLGAGLSVSHDSVFGLDISPESDVYSPQHHHRHHQTSTTAESLPSSASLQYMVSLDIPHFMFFFLFLLDWLAINFSV